jgi:tRNA-dihydrouridine synthase A
MMDWTDRYDRAFLRRLTRHTLLYSEMVVTGAILFGKRERFLDFDAEEQPLALQLGGSNPAELAQCARIAEDWGYCEVNLNVGCPSDRVSAGRFGACLMAEPDLVADCVSTMIGATTLPVTVKHRIGIDELDSYELLCRFIEKVAAAGCQTFIIHARKAWLNGLSPKENREVPPLRHDVVQQIKADFPQLEIILNGGLRSIEDCCTLMPSVDGCMIGRAAYETPYVMAQADHLIFADAHPIPDRQMVIESYLPYMAEKMAQGVPLGRMVRHILELFHGQPGGRLWRRHLSQNAYLKGAGLSVITDALAITRQAAQARAEKEAALGRGDA